MCTAGTTYEGHCVRFPWGQRFDTDWYWTAVDPDYRQPDTRAEHHHSWQVGQRRCR